MVIYTCVNGMEIWIWKLAIRKLEKSVEKKEFGTEDGYMDTWFVTWIHGYSANWRRVTCHLKKFHLANYRSRRKFTWLHNYVDICITKLLEKKRRQLRHMKRFRHYKKVINK